MTDDNYGSINCSIHTSKFPLDLGTSMKLHTSFYGIISAITHKNGNTSFEFKPNGTFLGRDDGDGCRVFRITNLESGKTNSCIFTETKEPLTVQIGYFASQLREMNQIVSIRADWWRDDKIECLETRLTNPILDNVPLHNENMVCHPNSEGDIFLKRRIHSKGMCIGVFWRPNDPEKWGEGEYIISFKIYDGEDLVRDEYGRFGQEDKTFTEDWGFPWFVKMDEVKKMTDPTLIFRWANVGRK